MTMPRGIATCFMIASATIFWVSIATHTVSNVSTSFAFLFLIIGLAIMGEKK